MQPAQAGTSASRAAAQHIAILILALGPGGAERLAANAANRWAKEGRKVTILTLAGPDAPPFYALDPAVRWLPLGLIAASSGPLEGLRNNLHRLRAVRRAMADLRPDAVLSFMDRETVTAAVALCGLGLPVVGYVVSDPRATRLGRPWGLVRRVTYPWLDGLVVQTERARDYFSARVRRKVLLLPNAVPRPPPEALTDLILPRPCLITVGRLVDVKNHALMVRAFARVAGERPAWNLVVVGEGELRPALEDLVGRLGLADRVLLPGLTKHPHAAYRQAEAFVLSSKREGFPMALCEAMSCGLPAVVTDCPSGPREIVRHGVDGLLVPDGDEAALAAAMARVMDDAALRQAMGSRALDVLDRFDEGTVHGRLSALLDDLATRRR